MEEEIPQEQIVHVSDYEPISEEVLRSLPESLVKKSLTVPLQKKDGRLLVGVTDLLNVVKPAGLQMVTGCPVDLVQVPLEEVTLFIKTHYKSSASEAPPENEGPSLSVITPKPKTDSISIPNFVHDALVDRATEIVLSLTKKKVSLRYRIRGVMIDPNNKKSLTFEQTRELLSLVRNKGELTESHGIHFNRYQTEITHEKQNYWAEFMFTETNEKSVLTVRMGEKKESIFQPKNWGLDGDQTKALEEILSKKQGVVLISGPKYEHIEKFYYGCLRKISDPKKHTMSIESRAEEPLSDIDQFVSKNDPEYFDLLVETSLTHHPDNIGIKPLMRRSGFRAAFEGALSGSLVLGRTFAVDTADILYQLLRSNLESYPIGSVLLGIVSAQMIRLNCQECLVRDPDGIELARWLDIPTRIRPSQFFIGHGCERCGYTGFDKETNLFEVVVVNDAIRSFLDKNAKPEELREKLKRANIRLLRQTAIHKAINGQTSLSEVIRVTPR